MKRLFTIIVLCLALAVTGFAQGGGQGRGGRGGNSLMGLAGRADVQADLQLTDDQKSKLNDLRTQMRAARSAAGGGGNGGGAGGGGQRTPPTPEEIAARRAEELKQLSTILNPAQVTRLEEIRIQLAGDRAALEPEVQAKLGLSDDQKSKIADLNSKYMEAQRSIQQKVQNGEMDRQAGRDTRQKNTQTLQEDLHKLLSADQVEKLKGLGGKPFKADTGGGG